MYIGYHITKRKSTLFVNVFYLFFADLLRLPPILQRGRVLPVRSPGPGVLGLRSAPVLRFLVPAICFLVSGSWQLAEGSTSPGRNSRRGLHKTKAARNKRKTLLLIRFTDHTTIISKHSFLVLANHHKPIATRNKRKQSAIAQSLQCQGIEKKTTRRCFILYITYKHICGYVQRPVAVIQPTRLHTSNIKPLPAQNGNERKKKEKRLHTRHCKGFRA